jgi:hypothetical protein
MFHDVLHFQENAPMKGKVFAFELDRNGLSRSSRSIKADIVEWDDHRIWNSSGATPGATV